MMDNGKMPAMPVDRCDADAIEVGIQVFSGFTKREAMAMHMMSGLLSKPGHSFNEHDVARDATRAADALLAALERTK